MNTSVFLRLLNKSSKLFGKNGQYSRSMQKYDGIRMVMNVSAQQPRKELETFQDMLPCIMDTLLKYPQFSDLPELANWTKKILDYNLTGGKKGRGLTTVLAYEMLEKPENITEESLRLARVMGWCVEMLQSYLLILDDIMDRSTTRRGVPCWYRIPEVGLGAINDSILIYSSIHCLLKTYFSDQPQYIKILELFSETLMNTSIGQHLDYTMGHRVKNDYSLFTIERHNAIVKYKTAFYTYKLPVFLGLYLANKTDPEMLQNVESVLLDLGEYFQIQDDYIDIFGDESVTGKAGTDIQEGKCTWLAVMALQRCNTEQRALFEQCYGSDDPANVKRIKLLYEQLQLPQLYRNLERETYERIVQNSKVVSESVGANFTDLITRLLNMLYKRQQ